MLIHPRLLQGDLIAPLASERDVAVEVHEPTLEKRGDLRYGRREHGPRAPRRAQRAPLPADGLFVRRPEPGVGIPDKGEEGVVGEDVVGEVTGAAPLGPSADWMFVLSQVGAPAGVEVVLERRADGLGRGLHDVHVHRAELGDDHDVAVVVGHPRERRARLTAPRRVERYQGVQQRRCLRGRVRRRRRRVGGIAQPGEHRGHRRTSRSRAHPEEHQGRAGDQRGDPAATPVPPRRGRARIAPSQEGLRLPRVARGRHRPRALKEWLAVKHPRHFSGLASP